jgi:hypothetical protein
VTSARRAGAGTAPSADDDEAVALRLPAEPRFGAIGRLVFSGFVSRRNVGVDRLDDLVALAQTVLGQPAAERFLDIRIRRAGEAVELEAGPFATGPADLRSLQSALARLVDTVVVRHAARGAWIGIRVTPGSRAAGPAAAGR